MPVLKPDHPRDPEFQAALRALAPDCCPVVAYGALLPQSALDIPPHGWVNLHFSVLPAWRGAAPVQHAIWAGDEVTGATTFRIVKELDAGPTYGVMTERIRPDRHRRRPARPARRGRRRAAGGDPRRHRGRLRWRRASSRRTGVSFAPKITVEDARVDWTEPPMARRPAVRACTPAPGRLDDLRGRAGQARARSRLDRRGAAAPGELRGRQERRARRHRHRRGRLARSRRSARSRCRPPTGPAACGSRPAPGSVTG